MGDLLHLDEVRDRFRTIVEWKSLTLTSIYGCEPLNFDELFAWLKKYAEIFKPISAISANIWARLTAQARRSCSRLSWAHCGTLITASTR